MLKPDQPHESDLMSVADDPIVEKSLYSWLPGFGDYKLFHNAPPSQAKLEGPSPPPIDKFFIDPESKSADQQQTRRDVRSLNVIFLFAILVMYVVILVGLPILMIVLGALTLDKCPISSHLPRWLVVTGIGMILFNAIGILTRLSNKNIVNSRIPAIIGLFLSLTMFILFLIGSVLVYKNLKTVQRTNASLPTYCISMCYDFSLVIISLTYAFCVFSSLVFCIGALVAGFMR